MVHKNRTLDVCFKEINLATFPSCGRIFYRSLIKKKKLEDRAHDTYVIAVCSYLNTASQEQEIKRI